MAVRPLTAGDTVINPAVAVAGRCFYSQVKTSFVLGSGAGFIHPYKRSKRPAWCYIHWSKGEDLQGSHIHFTRG